VTTGHIHIQTLPLLLLLLLPRLLLLPIGRYDPATVVEGVRAIEFRRRILNEF